MDQPDRSSGDSLPIPFTAEDGVRWTVRELDADQANGRACLVFESDATVRRVRIFPSDWRGLDNTSLLALSWKT